MPRFGGWGVPGVAVGGFGPCCRKTRRTASLKPCRRTILVPTTSTPGAERAPLPLRAGWSGRPRFRCDRWPINFGASSSGTNAKPFVGTAPGRRGTADKPGPRVVPMRDGNPGRQDQRRVAGTPPELAARPVEGHRPDPLGGKPGIGGDVREPGIGSAEVEIAAPDRSVRPPDGRRRSWREPVQMRGKDKVRPRSSSSCVRTQSGHREAMTAGRAPTILPVGQPGVRYAAVLCLS